MHKNQCNLIEIKKLSDIKPKKLNISEKILKNFLTCEVDINSLPLYFLASEDTNSRLKTPIDLNTEIQMMSFAPYNLSGYNMCPRATKECKKVCLGDTKSNLTDKQKEHIKCKMLFSRVKRTILYKNHFEYFSNRLVLELIDKIKKAQKNKKSIVVRLNGYSDIKWEGELFEITCDDVRTNYYDIYKKEPISSNIMSLFPDIQFYDYTKYQYSERKKALLPENYHLTYSVSELSTKAEVAINLDNNRNVAIVVTENYKEKLMNKNIFNNYKVIDGDEYDYRPYDEAFKKNNEKGLIVLLKAISDATKIKSDFVYDDLSRLFG